MNRAARPLFTKVSCASRAYRVYQRSTKTRKIFELPLRIFALNSTSSNKLKPSVVPEHRGRSDLCTFYGAHKITESHDRTTVVLIRHRRSRHCRNVHTVAKLWKCSDRCATSLNCGHAPSAPRLRLRFVRYARHGCHGCLLRAGASARAARRHSRAAYLVEDLRAPATRRAHVGCQPARRGTG